MVIYHQRAEYNNRARSVCSCSRNVAVENVKFKNFTPFTVCMTNTQQQINNAKDLDVLMAMHNLLKCSNAYSKTFTSHIKICINIIFLAFLRS